MPKITLGMTGLRGNWGRDDGIEDPFWGPSTNIDCEQSIFSQSKFGRTGESEMAEKETGDRLLAVFYDYDPAFLLDSSRFSAFRSIPFSLIKSYKECPPVGVLKYVQVSSHEQDTP